MLDAGGPWVLVDLSNVCRDETLCRPNHRADLRAFDALQAALESSNLRFGRVRAIADRSLYRLLDDVDKARLRQLVKDKLVVETPMADETLMEASFSDGSPFQGALIVSRDGFADFRIDYPEIQGSKDRFLDWKRQPSGNLTVRFRDMGQFTHMRISRKVEEGELKERRIFNSTVRDRAVRQRYRCSNKGCIQAQLWPDSLPQLPSYDRSGDCFRCPGCGDQLEMIGVRPRTTQVVVFADGDEVCRLLLEEGEHVVLGREDRKGCVGLSTFLGDVAASEISRRHLELSVEGGVVQVADLGSKNGTTIETRRGRFERRKLVKGEVEPLSRKTRVRVASDVTLELSGRQNPFDGVRLGVQHTKAGAEHRPTMTGG